MKTFFKKHGISFFAVTLAGVIVFGSSFLIKQASAQFQFGAYISFGGEITNVDYTTCLCNGMILTIQEVQGGSIDLMLYYTSLATAVKREYQVYSSGANTLGLYSPGSPTCIEYTGTSCTTTSSDAQGYITLIGTSQN